MLLIQNQIEASILRTPTYWQNMPISVRSEAFDIDIYRKFFFTVREAIIDEISLIIELDL